MKCQVFISFIVLFGNIRGLPDFIKFKSQLYTIGDLIYGFLLKIRREKNTENQHQKVVSFYLNAHLLGRRLAARWPGAFLTTALLFWILEDGLGCRVIDSQARRGLRFICKFYFNDRNSVLNHLKEFQFGLFPDFFVFSYWFLAFFYSDLRSVRLNGNWFVFCRRCCSKSSLHE